VETSRVGNNLQQANWTNLLAVKLRRAADAAQGCTEGFINRPALDGRRWRAEARRSDLDSRI
jgi:hypothetical protein